MGVTRRLLLAVLSALVVGAACTSDDETGTTTGPETGPGAPFSLATAAEPYQGTEIRILDEITDLQPTFAKIIPQFEEETGITVNYELQAHPDVITVGESDLFSGRGAYDGVMLHSFQFPNAIQAGAIEYLNPFLDNESLRDPSVDFSNFIPINDPGTLYGDNRICFPNWDYNEVWIGRKDLIENPDEQAAFQEEYGYDLAPPQTLQQMRDIAEFFTRDAGEQLAGETLDRPFYGFTQDGSRLGTAWQDFWFNYVLPFGGDLFDENGTPTANRAENLAALEFWQSMFEFAPPGPSEVSLVDLPVIVGQGRVASAIGFSDFFFSLDSPGGSEVAGKLTYAPIPANADNPDALSAPVTVSCLVINAASENREATYLFLQWAVSQEAQDAWLSESNQEGGFVPVLQSSLENPDFTSGPRPELNAAIAGSLSKGKTWPLLQDFPQMLDPMLQRLQEVLLGQSTPQEALDGLQADLKAICPSDCLLQP
jgi:multiple sugar transport system substrate-binding protein